MPSPANLMSVFCLFVDLLYSHFSIPTIKAILFKIHKTIFKYQENIAELVASPFIYLAFSACTTCIKSTTIFQMK